MARSQSGNTGDNALAVGNVRVSPDGQRILISETFRTVSRLGALPVDGGVQVWLTPDEFLFDICAPNSLKAQNKSSGSSTRNRYL